MPPRPLLIVPQPPRLTAIALAHAAQLAGWQIIRTVGGRLPPHTAGAKLALYGDWLPVCQLAQVNRLELLAPDATWITRWPPDLLRRTVQELSWEHVQRLQAPTFLQPVDAGLFAADVYTLPGERPELRHVADTARVLASEPLEFEYEFRCFVSEGQVTALSPVRAGGVSCQRHGRWLAPEELHEQASEFCACLLADEAMEAPAAFALDVGLLSDGGWAVIQALAAWHAEIYGCSPLGVLQALQRCCHPPSASLPQDRPWLVRGTSPTAGWPR